MATKAIERTKLSPPQYAKRLGVSVAKVTHFIRTGQLKAMDVSANRGNRARYLIDLADIERFEKSRQVVPDGGLSTTQRLRRKAAAGVREFF